jgi:hypothetical protein
LEEYSRSKWTEKVILKENLRRKLFREVVICGHFLQNSQNKNDLLIESISAFFFRFYFICKKIMILELKIVQLVVVKKKLSFNLFP